MSNVKKNKKEMREKKRKKATASFLRGRKDPRLMYFSSCSLPWFFRETRLPAPNFLVLALLPGNTKGYAGSSEIQREMEE